MSNTGMIKRTNELLEANMAQLAQTAAQGLDPERFIRVALGAIRGNPGLQQCNPVSVVSALMESAALGLEPGPLGEAYLVPYKQECTLIPGYRGLVKLALQSGDVLDVTADLVREGDGWRYAQTTDGVEFEHTPDDWADEPGKIVGVYAVATLANGARKVERMTVREVERIRAGSRARNASAWSDHWGEMAKKTVIRRLFKHLPSSTEIQSRLARIEAVEYAPAMAPQDRRATGLSARAVRYALPTPQEQQEQPETDTQDAASAAQNGGDE